MSKRRTVKTTEPHDSIIVLGARVREDERPSEALKRRLSLALACYLERPVPVCCCGARGKREPVAEGAFMCSWLRDRGVPDAMLIAETASFDTMQNIGNAKPLLSARGLSRPLVVTSDYHVRRALAICRRNGLCANGKGSPSERRYAIKNHARELLAWVKFLLRL